MLNGEVEQAGGGGQDADLSGNLARSEIADEPHLARQAEPARHRASDLGRDAERHGRRVGDEDRLDAAAVCELEHELPGAVDGRLVADDPRRA